MSYVFKQKSGIDPLRAWGRYYLPSDGLVCADLDYGFRRYGPNFGLDQEGDLMLLEKKEYCGKFNGGQVRIYDWISNHCAADKAWRGWHKIRVLYETDALICPECKQPIENDDVVQRDRFSNASLAWNGEKISHEQYRNIVLGEWKGKQPLRPLF